MHGDNITHLGALKCRRRNSAPQMFIDSVRNPWGSLSSREPVTTPSAAVKSSTSRAFRSVSMSPFANTGVRTRDLMS